MMPLYLFSIIGLAAYELGSAISWIMNKNVGPYQHPYLSEAINCFEKASEILSFEPIGTNHSMVGQSAAKELEHLKLEQSKNQS